MKIVRASSTVEESRLLHAALADFSRDGPRAVYAKWLAAKGDTDRARALLATIKAFHTLNDDPLDELEVDPCWARMIAIPLLQVLAEARPDHGTNDLKALRDMAFPRLRPALSLACTPCPAEPAIGASYLWGQPDMPEDEAWPNISALSNWSDGKPNLPQDHHAAWLGQIAFSDLRETVLGQELPQTGGFAVFSITETWKLGIVETLVRPWNNKAPLTRRPVPPDLIADKLGDGTNAPHPAHDFELEDALSLPDAT
jgi:hypothetical protein